MSAALYLEGQSTSPDYKHVSLTPAQKRFVEGALKESVDLCKPEHEVIFWLVGKIKGAFPSECAQKEPSEAVLAIASHFCWKWGGRDSSQADVDAWLIKFEGAWTKRSYPSQSKLPEACIIIAGHNRLGLQKLNRWKILVANLGFALFTALGDRPFLIPVNEKTANLLDGCDKEALRLAVKWCEDQKIFKKVSDADYPQKKARAFTFNKRHPIFTGKIRSAKEAVLADLSRSWPVIENGVTGGG